MRIGLVAPLGSTFDAFFQEIVHSWEKQGHSIHLLSGQPARTMESTVVPSITRRPSPANLKAPKAIEGWANSNRLDVILANTATGAAVARLRKLKVPVVYFCHGLHWNVGTNIEDLVWQSAEKYLLRNTHAVICMNSDDRSWFRRRMDENRILFLPFGVGVPLRNYTPSRLPGGQTLRLLWTGEFSDRKRPELMLEIASRLKDRGVQFDLKMLGKGSKFSEISREVEELGLLDVIELPGHQPIQEFIRNSHIFVHTAKWEGLPRVMLEARAMRRQSIAFDVKGVRDIPDAVLISEGDIDGYVDAVESLRDGALSKDFTLPPVSEEMDSSAVATFIIEYLQTTL